MTSGTQARCERATNTAPSGHMPRSRVMARSGTLWSQVLRKHVGLQNRRPWFDSKGISNAHGAVLESGARLQPIVSRRPGP